jgi:hypothetical protein
MSGVPLPQSFYFSVLGQKEMYVTDIIDIYVKNINALEIYRLK